MAMSGRHVVAVLVGVLVAFVVAGIILATAQPAGLDCPYPEPVTDPTHSHT
jgi:hypothetical protein